MTRANWYQSKNKLSDEKMKIILAEECPSAKLMRPYFGVDIDHATEVKKEGSSITVGCRNITCEACWNTSYKTRSAASKQ